MNPTAPLAQHTAQERAAALRIFIKSGSANGNEPMRRELLSLVREMASAPELLAVAQMADRFGRGECALTNLVGAARAAIARATGRRAMSQTKYHAPTKISARDALREMLAALDSDDSARYWQAFETLSALHAALTALLPEYCPNIPVRRKAENAAREAIARATGGSQ